MDILMNPKKEAVLDRIRDLEDAIAKGREYLETGQHAQWNGCRLLFNSKVRDGKKLRSHKDWVKNVFLPRCEGGLRHARKYWYWRRLSENGGMNSPYSTGKVRRRSRRLTTPTASNETDPGSGVAAKVTLSKSVCAPVA